jgi:hypothetical protein
MTDYGDETWGVVVANDGSGTTERLRVPGGWIYRPVKFGERDAVALALVFVPDTKE